MSKFENVDEIFGNLIYMRHGQAGLMRELIMKHEVSDVLEIGFYHGKSSAYFAAILEDLGRGHLTTVDLQGARARKPNIDQVLSTLGLAHRVTPIFAERSYTWELAKMIRSSPRPQFDFCYFDGGHTWDATALGFTLVDMLLRPGGFIVFDDMEWTIEAAMRERAEAPAHWRACSADERSTPAVKLVFELLLPHFGYINRRVINEGKWGLARKPSESARFGARSDSRGPFKRLTKVVTGR